jgi:hypothetical protein
MDKHQNPTLIESQLFQNVPPARITNTCTFDANTVSTTINFTVEIYLTSFSLITRRTEAFLVVTNPNFTTYESFTIDRTVESFILITKLSLPSHITNTGSTMTEPPNAELTFNLGFAELTLKTWVTEALAGRAGSISMAFVLTGKLYTAINT